MTVSRRHTPTPNSVLDAVTSDAAWRTGSSALATAIPVPAQRSIFKSFMLSPAAITWFR